MKDKALIWQRHLLKQQKSSLTIQAYCAQHQLSPGMFYYWKRKLSSPDSHEQFAEIEIIEPDASSGIIHVRFPSGIEMWLDRSTEVSFLRVLAGC
jgi:hypothetical protein